MVPKIVPSKVLNVGITQKTLPSCFDVGEPTSISISEDEGVFS